jgi:hypothetical protein
VFAASHLSLLVPLTALMIVVATAFIPLWWPLS